MGFQMECTTDTSLYAASTASRARAPPSSPTMTRSARASYTCATLHPLRTILRYTLLSDLSRPCIVSCSPPTALRSVTSAYSSSAHSSSTSRPRRMLMASPRVSLKLTLSKGTTVEMSDRRRSCCSDSGLAATAGPVPPPPPPPCPPLPPPPLPPPVLLAAAPWGSTCRPTCAPEPSRGMKAARPGGRKRVGRGDPLGGGGGGGGEGEPSGPDSPASSVSDPISCCRLSWSSTAAADARAAAAWLDVAACAAVAAAAALLARAPASTAVAVAMAVAGLPPAPAPAPDAAGAGVASECGPGPAPACDCNRCNCRCSSSMSASLTTESVGPATAADSAPTPLLPPLLLLPLGRERSDCTDTSVSGPGDALLPAFQLTKSQEVVHPLLTGPAPQGRSSAAALPASLGHETMRMPRFRWSSPSSICWLLALAADVMVGAAVARLVGGGRASAVADPAPPCRPADAAAIAIWCMRAARSTSVSSTLSSAVGPGPCATSSAACTCCRRSLAATRRASAAAAARRPRAVSGGAGASALAGSDAESACSTTTLSEGSAQMRSSCARSAQYCSGCSTAKHRSSISLFSASHPRHSAIVHHTSSVSSATARCLSGLSTNTVRMLCSRSASLMRMTSGSSNTMSTIILRSDLKCCGLYSAQPLRLPRRSSWFIWLSLDTLATMDATAGPNSAWMAAMSTAVSSTTSCSSEAIIASVYLSYSAAGGRLCSTMRAVSMQ
mmetsp:Transcript_2426/g.6181  ORF Transcript_2426/g.6181 Transcript_2426/m.6181 type:complete len:726 (+) Transcript_2426:2280-4457(+)